ncbi:MAG: hypothetical protein WA240_09750 [Nitrospirota bacterium]
MNTLTKSYNVSNGSEMTCPYCNMQRDICMAAVSSYSLTEMGSINYCNDEDYDDCPIFLAKLLRGDINYKEEIFPTLRNKGNKKACYI